MPAEMSLVSYPSVFSEGLRRDGFSGRGRSYSQRSWQKQCRPVENVKLAGDSRMASVYPPGWRGSRPVTPTNANQPPTYHANEGRELGGQLRLGHFEDGYNTGGG